MEEFVWLNAWWIYGQKPKTPFKIIVFKIFVLAHNFSGRPQSSCLDTARSAMLSVCWHGYIKHRNVICGMMLYYGCYECFMFGNFERCCLKSDWQHFTSITTVIDRMTCLAQCERSHVHFQNFGCTWRNATRSIDIIEASISLVTETEQFSTWLLHFWLSNLAFPHYRGPLHQRRPSQLFRVWSTDCWFLSPEQSKTTSICPVLLAALPQFGRQLCGSATLSRDQSPGCTGERKPLVLPVSWDTQ